MVVDFRKGRHVQVPLMAPLCTKSTAPGFWRCTLLTAAVTLPAEEPRNYGERPSTLHPSLVLVWFSARKASNIMTDPSHPDGLKFNSQRSESGYVDCYLALYPYTHTHSVCAFLTA